ncbi:Uncharacterised protein [Vibrio cholerae]|nr:Uncharacterised protein [Vibrio cholerae]
MIIFLRSKSCTRRRVAEGDNPTRSPTLHSRLGHRVAARAIFFRQTCP